MSKKTSDISRLLPEELANVLSNSVRRKITPEQVLQIANKGGIIQPDGRIDLVKYTAIVVMEESNGRSN